MDYGARTDPRGLSVWEWTWAFKWKIVQVYEKGVKGAG